jgi:hypothetical protein
MKKNFISTLQRIEEQKRKNIEAELEAERQRILQAQAINNAFQSAEDARKALEEMKAREEAARKKAEADQAALKLELENRIKAELSKIEEQRDNNIIGGRRRRNNYMPIILGLAVVAIVVYTFKNN